MDSRTKKTNNKRFVRYSEGAEMYSMSVSKFMQLAKDAKACYKVNQLVLVNLDIIDEYLETFHIVDGGIQMVRTGRPKADKPFDHKVTVKFKEEEYQIMVEYAETHNLSISQLIRMGVELQMKQQANQ